MATAWDEISGRAMANIGQAHHSTGSSATLDEEPVRPTPTRGHKACIAELALRFPAARDVDQRQYQARLDFLAEDTAHIAVPLLRAACDRVAREAKGLPYASEILKAATEIVEERQRVRAASERGSAGQSGSATDSRVAALHRANLDAMARGWRVMQADDGELFQLGGPGERRGVRGDGSAIVPWFHHSKGADDPVPPGFYVRQEDVAALRACYERFGSQFVLRGAAIVERQEV